MAHMSTRQYARLVPQWVISTGPPPQDYGDALAPVNKIDSTVRYLGMDVEDALELAERPEG
mgnify:CR=1 FL=1